VKRSLHEKKCGPASTKRARSERAAHQPGGKSLLSEHQSLFPVVEVNLVDCLRVVAKRLGDDRIIRRRVWQIFQCAFRGGDSFAVLQDFDFDSAAGLFFSLGFVVSRAKFGRTDSGCVE